MADAFDSAAAEARADYGYKPALLGPVWHFRLTPDAIEWEAGPRAGRTPYAEIRRLRLSFRPLSTQPWRFVAEIWPARGEKLQLASSSWRGMVDHERHDDAYRAFILELHCRLADASAAFESGSPAWRYWPGLVIFAAVMLALAALAMQQAAAGAWSATAFVGAVLALFLWQAGGYFRRNRPGRYRPQAPPRQLLP
jgi:hypothetical protein